MNQVEQLEEQLNDFDPEARAEALDKLIALTEQGEVSPEPMKEVANMHAHTFFSYNGYGYSPTGLAWLAKRRGFKLMGTVDFDVLDAADEFLRVCDKLGIRGSVGMETRTFIPEFSTREINSPGEPGVYYHMGVGYTSSDVPQDVADIADELRARASERNKGLMARINPYMTPATIDYEKDVLPLAPANNPTERHMSVAYIRAAERSVEDVDGFWAEKLAMPRAEVAAQRADPPQFRKTVRAKLMKRGGVGYVTPSYDTFPPVEKVDTFTVGCRALPCATWLDGLSEGEQHMEELLELLIAKGSVALNIVPDRNWNVADPDLKRVKLQNLYDIVDLAQRLDLPLNVGTEMNSFGQKLIDTFNAPELQPVRKPFLDGAYFVYGHTVLERALRLGYQSQWTAAHLPTRRARNAFYTQVGRLVPPGEAGFAQLEALSPERTPEQFLSQLSK